MSTTISFWSEDTTNRLRKALEPDADRIRRLLKSLPLKANASDDFVEKALKKLCGQIGNYASSEIQRYGWHRGLGVTKAVHELEAVKKAGEMLINKMGNCHAMK